MRDKKKLQAFIKQFKKISEQRAELFDKYFFLKDPTRDQIQEDEALKKQEFILLEKIDKILFPNGIKYEQSKFRI